MTSVPTAGGAPPPAVRSSLAEEAEEGVLLCRFVIRMRARNRVVQDTLTRQLTVEVVEEWVSFISAELLRLSVESRANGMRAAAMRDRASTLPGSGDSAHDYRHLDARLLDRRAQVGRAVSRVLRKQASEVEELFTVLREATAEARSELNQAVLAAGLRDEDAGLIAQRIVRLEDALETLVRTRRHVRRRVIGKPRAVRRNTSDDSRSTA